MFKQIIAFMFVFSLLALPILAEADCFYYFHGKDCDDCDSTNLLMEQLAKKYPELKIEKFEVYYNKENYQKLQDYFTVYSVPDSSQQVPAVFTGLAYFVGEESINALLEQHLKDNSLTQCPTLNEEEVIGITGEGSPKNVLETLTFGAVTGAAYRDNFKVGGLALVLVLLGLLVVMGDEVKMLKKGFTFVVAVYIALLLFGVGFFSWLAGQPGLSKIFYKTVGLIGVVFGLAKVKGFFGSPIKIVFENWSPAWRIWLKKIGHWLLSYPGMFIIGFLATLFTFSGVSDVLLSLRVLFSDSSIRWIVFPMLLYYVFVFALRVIAIVLLLFFVRQKLEKNAKAKGFSSDSKLELWRKHYMKVYQFVIGVVILIIGLILLFV